MNVIVLVLAVLIGELAVALDGLGVVPLIKVIVLVIIVFTGGLVVVDV